MQHAGWVASYVADMGVLQAAEVPADKVASVRSTAEARERAQAPYTAKSPEAGNPNLRSDLERAATQHAFHRRVIKGMP